MNSIFIDNFIDLLNNDIKNKKIKLKIYIN